MITWVLTMPGCFKPQPHSSYKILRQDRTGSRHQILVFVFMGICAMDKSSFHKTVWVHQTVILSSPESLHVLHKIPNTGKFNFSKKSDFHHFWSFPKHAASQLTIWERNQLVIFVSETTRHLPIALLRFCSQLHLGGGTTEPLPHKKHKQSPHHSHNSAWQEMPFCSQLNIHQNKSYTGAIKQYQ